MNRHDRTGGLGHRERRSVAVVIAVKVAIVALVLVLPSALALSLGAAHGVALVLVAVVAGVLFAVRVVKRGRRHMLIAETTVRTANASRYLVQLCQHATKVGHRLPHLHARAPHERPEVLDVDWSDTHGTLTLSSGRCVLDADPTALRVRVEAADEEKLRRVRDIVTADLERFGRRDQLTVVWQMVQVDETG